MNHTFSHLKLTISGLQQDAMKDANCNVLRSRGKWLEAVKDGEKLIEAGTYPVKTKSKLTCDVNYLINLGAQEIYIDGGYDGADSVHAMNNGEYSPWVSDWSLKIWDSEQRWLI